MWPSRSFNMFNPFESKFLCGIHETFGELFGETHRIHELIYRIVTHDNPYLVQ